MIDVKVLRAAGLTDAQIITLFEAEQEAERDRIERRRTLAAERMRRMRERHVTQRDASHPQENVKLPDISMNGYASHVTRNIANIGDLLVSKKESKKDSLVRLDEIEQAFATFYAAFPRKEHKGRARREFIKALKKTTLPEIMAALAKAKTKPQWRDLQFVPHPATWLRDECWLDEIVVGLFGKQSPWKEEGVL